MGAESVVFERMFRKARKRGVPLPCYILLFTPKESRVMKTLLAICMIFTATLAWAGEHTAAAKPASAVVKGEVLEVKNVANYTYLRLKTKDGETWAAVLNTPVKEGATVAIENYTVMHNFQSKDLKKTFPTILLGTLGSAGGSAQDAHVMGAAYPNLGQKKDADDIHVPKADGADARTVAEIMMKSAELKDKPVLVRGKVVKYNPAIMGKNWVHLRDGSGSAADNTNDILVTTASETKIGDVVTAKGIVRTNKDFGAGYSYKVLIEEATLQ
jgi:hypothetical protein